MVHDQAGAECTMGRKIPGACQAELKPSTERSEHKKAQRLLHPSHPLFTACFPLTTKGQYLQNWKFQFSSTRSAHSLSETSFSYLLFPLLLPFKQQ